MLLIVETITHMDTLHQSVYQFNTLDTYMLRDDWPQAGPARPLHEALHDTTYPRQQIHFAKQR